MQIVLNNWMLKTSGAACFCLWKSLKIMSYKLFFFFLSSQQTNGEYGQDIAAGQGVIFWECQMSEKQTKMKPRCLRNVPNRSSYLRCSHPRLTWPIVASRSVASLQSKFAAGTAFSLSFFPLPLLIFLSPSLNVSCFFFLIWPLDSLPRSIARS